MKVRRRKPIALLRGEVTLAGGPNQHWSVDFVHDQMLDGCKFRVLTVIDQWSRGSVMLEAKYRLSGRCVGQALDDWAYWCGVKLDDKRPCKRTGNGLIESFNGPLRDEFLDVNEFITKHDMREKMAAWQHDYNHCRPHTPLGHPTPSGFATMRSAQLSEAPNP